MEFCTFMFCNEYQVLDFFYLCTNRHYRYANMNILVKSLKISFNGLDYLIYTTGIQPFSWGRILGRNSRQKSYAFSSLLLTVTATASPWDFYFFKLTQPFTVSVKETGGKPDRRPYPLRYGLRNLQKSQVWEWNCTFTNSASGCGPRFRSV